MGISTNAGVIKFLTNGTEKMKIANNGDISCSGTLQTGGNLGVGTSATNGINLAIEKYLRIEGTATNNPTKATGN